ncbi:MAG: Hsp20/alpha crystallin family protein [Leptospiraceae bacterium]|nr:Hsp20/alpha crystallin family protein [Leptospiraceae bacterium]MCB1321406.1 Hsp20/alpha crystallin family protein [Leptospiraceae bacterium]
MGWKNLMTREETKEPDTVRGSNGFASDFDRLFNDLMGSVWGLGNWAHHGGKSLQAISPQLDISEDEKAYTIKADLPGMNEKDIDVSVEDDTLYIKAERRLEHEEEDKKRNYHRIERSYGSYQRALRLPEDVNRDKIDANYKDGVLTIALEKSPNAKPERRRIELK